MSQLNLPTLITLLRLIGVPLVMVGLATELWSPWWTVLIFFIAAGTDWLDGYLARRLNQETELGKFLDPLVDKLLVLGPFLMFVELNVIPAWAVFIVISRDLIISGWRVSATHVSGANMWGKVKTTVQLSAIVGLLLPVSYTQGAEPSAFLLLLKLVAFGLFWLSIPLTVLSALVYLWPSVTGAVKGRSQGEE